MKYLMIINLLMALGFAVQAQNKPVSYQDAYSVYITNNLKASRDFYTKWLDFSIVHESTWFIMLQSKGDPKFTFGLIDVEHPSAPPSYGPFNGQGSFFTLQVADAKSVYDKLKAAGAPITYHLKKEDWGQLRFGLTDPNGLYVDVVEQVEPVAGYWEKYMVRE